MSVIMEAPFVNPVRVIEMLDGDGSTRYFFFRGEIFVNDVIDENPSPIIVEVHDAAHIYVFGLDVPVGVDAFTGE